MVNIFTHTLHLFNIRANEKLQHKQSQTGAIFDISRKIYSIGQESAAAVLLPITTTVARRTISDPLRT